MMTDSDGGTADYREQDGPCQFCGGTGIIGAESNPGRRHCPACHAAAATEPSAKVHQGDFRIALNPFPRLTDEDGEHHCPMGALRPKHGPDDDDEDAEWEKVLCGEILYVEWRIWHTVPDEIVTPKDASGWANGARWELRCSGGHVIATSDDDSCSDDCPPFDPRYWL